jgi:beta-mannanase
VGAGSRPVGQAGYIPLRVRDERQLVFMGKKPQQFKAAWRRIHGLFRHAGAENIKWMFAPNTIFLNVHGLLPA